MATNHTFAQVVKAYADGTNQELMIEIGRRYPLLMAHVSKLIALAGDEFVAFASTMPEHITANKLNKALLACDDAEAEVETDANDEAEDDGEDGEQDLSSMTSKELYNLCIKKGLKVSKYGKSKSYYIEALNGGSDDGEEDEAEVVEDNEDKPAKKSSKKVAKVEEAEDEEDDEDGEQNAYEGKSAMELFKECKKRGVKAQPKKPAKYYVELLTKADEAAKDAGDDDDDWDADDAEVEEKEPTKKAAKKETKKAAEDDDDEDWEI